MGCYSKDFLVAGFARWLALMNYDPSSIYNGPRRIADFLDWMHTQGVYEVDEIKGSKVKEFFEVIAKRKSKVTGDVWSLATLRNYLTTINRFARYLRQSGIGNIDVPVKFKGRQKKPTVILTQSEIERLYGVCGDGLMGMRDRAMLAIYYGCGVRRNEGLGIEIKDILADRNLLYIRNGKGHKERYVPMVGQVKKDIINYVTMARPIMVNRISTESFFIGLNGRAIGSTALYERMKKLLTQSRIDKKVGLHTLRHSIATHLLINGMKLSEIAKFLGHSSLESTQIYTHLKDAI